MEEKNNVAYNLKLFFTFCIVLYVVLFRDFYLLCLFRFVCVHYMIIIILLLLLWLYMMMIIIIMIIFYFANKTNEWKGTNEIYSILKKYTLVLFYFILHDACSSFCFFYVTYYMYSFFVVSIRDHWPPRCLHVRVQVYNIQRHNVHDGSAFYICIL